MEIDTWEKIVNAGWNLQKLRELLEECKKLSCKETSLIMINMQIKLIMLKLCVSEHIYVPSEIWMIIIGKTNHMTYFNPCKTYGKETITCHIKLRTYKETYPVKINQIYRSEEHTSELQSRA